ncbi:MAG: hypothetical protein VX609_05705, partial [Verrucomicrobiota bacterium]|nr:hypothetical protein [Verrucomicrobiota bacterium]
DADAWATSLMILGPVEGMKKANELDLVARFSSSGTNGVGIKSSVAYDRLFGKTQALHLTTSEETILSESD